MLNKNDIKIDSEFYKFEEIIIGRDIFLINGAELNKKLRDRHIIIVPVFCHF
ncbi:MAG: hypothetical protein ACUZ8H_00390 [Candidatus Anammoxibacter sp.]